MKVYDIFMYQFFFTYSLSIIEKQYSQWYCEMRTLVFSFLFVEALDLNNF